MLNIRPMAPSKGPKRYRRRRSHFVPGQNVLRLEEDQTTRVRNLVVNLKAKGWKFEFKVTARSPRGFAYTAEASSMDQAIMQSVGAWKKEVTSIEPAAPAAAEEPKKPVQLAVVPAAAPADKKKLMPADIGIRRISGGDPAAEAFYMQLYREFRSLYKPRSRGLVTEGLFDDSKQPGYTAAAHRYWKDRMRRLVQQQKQMAEAA